MNLMRDAIQKAGYSRAAGQSLGSGPLFVYAVALSNRAETRAQGIRRLHDYIRFGRGFTVRAYFALANVLEAQGDLAGAAEAYAHVVRIWKNTDLHLEPQVVKAREALARLTGEGR
jgi:hypothetical protein